jgi:hypothetical protein
MIKLKRAYEKPAGDDDEDRVDMEGPMRGYCNVEPN